MHHILEERFGYYGSLEPSFASNSPDALVLGLIPNWVPASFSLGNN
jgi:hypothetical protein